MIAGDAASDLVKGGEFTAAALGEPAAVGLSALLSERLARVVAAHERLSRKEDSEALHDFRVALRRLRSLLRVYRDLLGSAVPRRLVRRLRRLARITNASRDLEVKLNWLSRQRSELRPRDSVGLRWLTARLTAQKEEADQQAHDRIATELPKLEAALERRCASLPRRVADRTPLALVTQDLIRTLETELRTHLDQVTSSEHQQEAHAARITGKRVRYLLETVSNVIPHAAELVGRFKQLQDSLGEMHDADVASQMVAEAMEAAAAERGRRVATEVRAAGTLDKAALRRERRRDPMPGLIALAGQLRLRRESAWRVVQLEWLGQQEERLLGQLEAVARALGPFASAAVEIERKFLLSAMPAQLGRMPAAVIEQGYLPGEQIQERIRRSSGPSGTTCWRTVKLGAGLVRQEFEEEMPESMFETLWPLTEGRRVAKRRYRVTDGDLTWEVDDFTDRTLVLAEVELPSSDTEVAVPDWLVPFVVREVTDEPEYVNINLAR
jgi:CHAD domain-containing protein/CYTH domain-containing protein